MYQNRDQTRQVFLDVWQKLQAGKVLEPMENLIAEVIEMHPEYHGLLNDNDNALQNDFNPDLGSENPFMHMGMHIALREQATTDRPPGFTAEYTRLTRKKKNQHEAEHGMMECLGQALWLAQRQQRPPDDAAYLNCLKRL